MSSTRASASDSRINHATVFGLARHYVGPTQFQVSLSPLTTSSDPLGAPSGCLARPQPVVDPDHAPTAANAELAILTWTTMAVDALHPDTFLAVAVSPEVVLAPTFNRTVAQLPCDRLMLLFETGRAAARRVTLDQAVTIARRYGIRVAVGGNRLTSAAGFDAAFVAPSTSSVEAPVTDTPLLVAMSLRTNEDIEWAKRIGAHLFEGPALADPMTVAPVDLRRLNRA